MRRRSLIVAAVIGCAGCKEPVAVEPLPVAVRVEPFRASTVRSEVPYSGTVREKQRFELSFKVAGTVQSLLKVKGADGAGRDVQAGDVLPRDAVIARLDEADYARQRDLQREILAQLEAKRMAAEAGAENASSELQRTERLIVRNMVPKQEYETNQARSKAAQAEVLASAREVESARVRLRQAEDDLANCRLKVPVDRATVAAKLVEPYERVTSGRTVFTLLDTSMLKVAFGVSDRVVGKLRLGQEVPVLSDAFRGETFKGRIRQIAPNADEQTRTFLVEVAIEQPRELLRPGMVVTLAVGERTEAYRLPLTAIRRGDAAGDHVVFKVASEGGNEVARRCLVAIAGIADDRIQISPGGTTDLTPGDRIVTVGAGRLHDGQVVRVLDNPDIHKTDEPIK